MQVFQYFIYKSAQVWFRHIKNIFFFSKLYWSIFIACWRFAINFINVLQFDWKKIDRWKNSIFLRFKKKCLKKVKTNHTKIDPTNINKNKHMDDVNERKYKQNQQKCELSYMCMCITHIVYMYTMYVCETRC